MKPKPNIITLFFEGLYIGFQQHAAFFALCACALIFFYIENSSLGNLFSLGALSALIGYWVKKYREGKP